MFDEIPFLGAGLGYQDELHADIIAHRAAIDFLEIPTDQFLRNLPDWDDRLLELKSNFTTVAHGVYMSLGDAGGAHTEYLDRLAPYIERLNPVWFSDHIDMGNIPEDELGMYFHGMQVPFTDEQVSVFRRNMSAFSARIGRPLLVENIFYKFVFPMPRGMSEPTFISKMLTDSNWGLLLDVTNVYINSLNFGFDPYAWLDEAPLERALEIHVAGGEQRTGGSWAGKWADTHSQPVPDDVWRLVEYVVARGPVKAVLLERDQNYPPIEDLVAELEIARSLLPQHLIGPTTGSSQPGSGARLTPYVGAHFEGREVRKTSLEAVQRIIGRAVTDSEFRNLLKADPKSVYAGRDVTPEEVQALGSMDWDAVGSVSRDLDARISRMGVAHASCK